MCYGRAAKRWKRTTKQRLIDLDGWHKVITKYQMRVNVVMSEQTVSLCTDQTPDESTTADQSDTVLYDRIKCFVKWCRDLLDIPLILGFGIVLYIVDVGSDILAALDHFEEGHPIWGSLVITFVVLPALCWAAVSWTEWYYDEDEKKEHPTRRRIRMLLAVLMLDPLTR